MNNVNECLLKYQTQLITSLERSNVVRHTHPPVNTLQADCAYCQLYGNVAMQDVVVGSKTDGLYLFLKH
jgi:hypothetical protein